MFGGWSIITQGHKIVSTNVTYGKTKRRMPSSIGRVYLLPS